MNNTDFKLIFLNVSSTISEKEKRSCIEQIKNFAKEPNAKFVAIRITDHSAISEVFPSIVKIIGGGENCRIIKKGKSVSKIQNNVERIVKEGNYNTVILVTCWKGEERTIKLHQKLGLNLSTAEQDRIIKSTKTHMICSDPSKQNTLETKNRVLQVL